MSQYWGRMPYWLIISGVKSLLGEVYPEIRAISTKYEPEKKYLLIRYYMDRDPIKKDYESIQRVALNLKYLANQYIESFHTECFYSLIPLGKIVYLDGFLYRRYEEYDENDVITQLDIV